MLLQDYERSPIWQSILLFDQFCRYRTGEAKQVCTDTTNSHSVDFGVHPTTIQVREKTMTTQKVKFGRSQTDAVIHAPIDKVNIGEWMFTLASEDYAACAAGHQSCALGALPDGKRVCVNIESVGGVFMVQNYIETVSEPDHVLGVSANSAMWTPDGEELELDCMFHLHVVIHGKHTTV